MNAINTMPHMKSACIETLNACCLRHKYWEKLVYDLVWCEDSLSSWWIFNRASPPTRFERLVHVVVERIMLVHWAKKYVRHMTPLRLEFRLHPYSHVVSRKEHYLHSQNTARWIEHVLLQIYNITRSRGSEDLGRSHGFSWETERDQSLLTE